MTVSEYYEALKQLARKQRDFFGLVSPKVTLTDMRKIYKHYGISFDLWPMSGLSGANLRSVKGAYFALEHGPCVLISRKLPPPQRVYTMAHELKHHLADRNQTIAFCHEANVPAQVEIGAEVFAAELIYPEIDFSQELKKKSIAYGACTAEDIVHLKHRTETTLSYTSLAKRAERLGFALPNSLPKRGWKKLEEKLYGEPAYKRINRYRQFNRRIVD
jgi:hypothetical protein